MKAKKKFMIGWSGRVNPAYKNSKRAGACYMLVNGPSQLYEKVSKSFGNKKSSGVAVATYPYRAVTRLPM